MRGCIPKLFFVRAIMKVVRNTVDDVKFIIVMKVCSVLSLTEPPPSRDKEILRRL